MKNNILIGLGDWASLSSYYSAYHRISYILFLLELLGPLFTNTKDILRILATCIISQILVHPVLKLNGANIHSTFIQFKIGLSKSKINNKKKERKNNKMTDRNYFNYPHFVDKEFR